MKRHKTGFAYACLVVACLFAVTLLCGCETFKGMGRDIKKADDWFRENAW